MKLIDALKIVLLLGFVAALSVSCHYRSINGDLDGNWQLMTIVDSEGRETHPVKTYYAIGMHTVNLFSSSAGKVAGNMAYDAEAGLVTIEFPMSASLGGWGLPDSPCTVNLRIMTLTSDSLVMQLESNGNKLIFRKF